MEAKGEAMATAGDTLPMHTEDGNVYLMTVAIGR
jgi:hypothetical protein